MNTTLILTGFFAIAILAFIGLIFTLRSERKAVTARAAVAVTEEAKPQQRDLVSAPEETLQESSPTGLIPPPSPDFLPTPPVEDILPPKTEEQLHALSMELHTLHQHAQELEHRLWRITDSLDQLEHARNNQRNRYGKITLTQLEEENT